MFHQNLAHKMLVGFTQKHLFLFICVLVGFPMYGQALRAINAKGRISRSYYRSDQVCLVVNDSLAGPVSFSGQLSRITADSIELSTYPGENRRFAVHQIKGIRKLPSLFTSLGAGLALGATIITIVDKRDDFSTPRIGLSLLIGAGTGITYWFVSAHRKSMRLPKRKGWSFLVR